MKHPTRPIAITLGLAASATALALTIASPASADPKGDVIAMQCEKLGTVGVIINGQGAATPGHVVGSTQVGVPYALIVTGTSTPTGGDPIVFYDQVTRRAPRNGNLDYCTFHYEFADETHSVVADGQVWISYTPAN